MTVPAGAVQTFAMVGIREDLSDVISNISPTETPFYSMCRKERTGSRMPEWQTDTLADADPDNAAIEGDDVVGDTFDPTVRLRNYVQLMDKTVIVSTTGQAVNTAGRADELRYQVAKRGQELKRDIEARLTQNGASSAGDASTAGTMAGAESWITTNADHGAGGSTPGYSNGTVAPPVDGTPRPVEESFLQNVVRLAWEAGGDPSVIMCGGFNKQALSAFSGIATQYKDNTARSLSRAVILGAADYYVSDFGEHRIIANRFQRDETVLVLDPSLWSVAFLQPFRTVPLGKTGHSDKRLLSCELTLKAWNEAGNAKVADLTTS